MASPTFVRFTSPAHCHVIEPVSLSLGGGATARRLSGSMGVRKRMLTITPSGARAHWLAAVDMYAKTTIPSCSGSNWR
jgi:hypothetical protein